MRGRILILSLSLLVAIAGVARASDPGVVRAQSFMPAPSASTIVVRPQDDSIDNLQIATEIVARLARRGDKPVSSDGRLLLTFTTAIVAADEGGRFTLGETGASDYSERSVTATQGDGTQIMNPEPRVPQGIGRQLLDSDIRVNVWSTNRDSLLQGAVPGSTRSGTPRYILSAILTDNETGQQLWRGEAVLDGASVNDLATFKHMVRPLVDYVGRDARNEKFWID